MKNGLMFLLVVWLLVLPSGGEAVAGLARLYAPAGSAAFGGLPTVALVRQPTAAPVAGSTAAADTTYVWYCNDTLIPGENTRMINSSGRTGEYAYRREMFIDGKRVRPDFQLRMIVESKGPEGRLSGEKDMVYPGDNVRIALAFKGKAPFRYRITGDKTEHFCLGTDTVIELTAVASMVYKLDYLADVDGMEAGFVKRTGKVVVYPAFMPGAIASVGESICPGSAPTETIGEAAAAMGGDGAYTYSWFADGVVIAGAINATYRPGALTTDATYTRKVGDGRTAATASAGEWRVTMNSPIAITTQPAAQTLCQAQTLTQSVAATGTAPLSYQWQREGTNIPGATGATYDKAGALPTDGGAYSCVVADKCGADTSDAVTVTVLPSLMPGAIVSTGETVCSGTTPLLIGETTAATGGDGHYTYSWYKDGVVIAGATSATYQPGALTVDATYTRKVNDGTCNTEPAASSGSYQITVLPEFNAGAIASTGETVCSGATPSLIGETTAATGGDGNYTYSWYKDGVVIAGATSATYQPGALTTDATYTRKVNDGTCNTEPAASANSYKITVLPEFNAGAIASTGETVCSGATPSLIGETTAATGGDGHYTYSWFADGVVIAGATGATYQPGALTTDATYTRKVNDGTFQTTPIASAGSYRVTVSPPPATATIRSLHRFVAVAALRSAWVHPEAY